MEFKDGGPIKVVQPKLEVVPRVEVMFGAPPEVKKVGDKTWAFSYSGEQLAKKPREPSEYNCAKIEVPFWTGGEAIVLYRPAPGHLWQDAGNIVVDGEHRLLGWSRSDGVTDVYGNKNNQSAAVARELTENLAMTPWGDKDWFARADEVVRAQHDQVLAANVSGAAAFQAGRIGRFLVNDKWEYGADVITCGSTMTVKPGGQTSGDAGLTEAFNERATINSLMMHQVVLPSEVNPHRSFVGDKGRPLSLQRASDRYDAKNPIWVVSYTDGIKGINHGEWNQVGMRIRDHLRTGITPDNVNRMWQGLSDLKLISSIDDVTLLAIKLPRKA